MSKRYLSIFPEAENVHLVKDVGSLAYALHKTHAYQATLACYKNGEYPYLEQELKGLELVFIKKISGSAFIDVLLFLLFNCSKYDTVQVFHFRLRSLIWLYFFKCLRGSKAQTYLKLDANEKVLDFATNSRFIKLKNYLLQKINIVSAETPYMQEAFAKLWQRPIMLIPNGFWLDNEDPFISFSEKENTLLTVARIGAPEKNHPLLLNAFAKIADKFPDWQLKLCGPIDKNFYPFIEQYFKNNPKLKDRVHFLGNVENRTLLKQVFNQSKIFCLSSFMESYAIVLVEAAFAGCYLLSSNIISAPYLTHNETFGSIFESDNETDLCKKLEAIILNKEKLEQNCTAVQSYYRTHFTWQKIVEPIAQKLNEH